MDTQRGHWWGVASSQELESGKISKGKIGELHPSS
jgi:hypothetical protein